RRRQRTGATRGRCGRDARRRGAHLPPVRGSDPHQRHATSPARAQEGIQQALTGAGEEHRRVLRVYLPLDARGYACLLLPPFTGEGWDGGRDRRRGASTAAPALPPPQPSPASGGGSCLPFPASGRSCLPFPASGGRGGLSCPVCGKGSSAPSPVYGGRLGWGPGPKAGGHPLPRPLCPTPALPRKRGRELSALSREGGGSRLPSPAISDGVVCRSPRAAEGVVCPLLY